MTEVREQALGKMQEAATRAGKTSDALFYDGHLMLDIAAEKALQGNESPDLISGATDKLTEAAELAFDNDELSKYFRIQTILPFMELMVYSPVINTQSLSTAAARRTKERFNFAGIYRALCVVAEDTLRIHDQLARKNKKSPRDHNQLGELVGILEEQTLLGLGMYAATPFEYATPSLHFDDAFTRKDKRIDATCYDNRSIRTNPSRGVQVKHSLNEHNLYDSDEAILLIEGMDLGNDFMSAKWFGNKKSFTTLRTLLNREFHGISGPQHMSNIERIRRDLFKNAENPDREALRKRIAARSAQGSAALKLLV